MYRHNCFPLTKPHTTPLRSPQVPEPRKTPATSAKKQKKQQQSSVPTELGAAVVGRQVEVFWEPTRQWFEGVIRKYNSKTKQHLIRYVRGARGAPRQRP